MEKANAVLVLPNENLLMSAIKKFDFDKVNLLAVMTEKADGDALEIGGQSIALIDFSAVEEILNSEPECLWIICNLTDEVKEHLIQNGVAERDMINFKLRTPINREWLANLRWLEENGAVFFITGGSQAMVGLDLNYMPVKGVNLSGTNQSLRQGYQTAKHVFEHVKPGTIKFVLIDLSPYLFPSAEESEEFDALNTQATSAEDVDLNCERAKETFRQKFSGKKQTKISKLPTKENLKEYSQILQDYAKLCFDNGARPVFVIFSVAQALRKTYNADILTQLRQAVNELSEKYKFVFIDLFSVKLAVDCFYDNFHLTSIGATTTTAIFGARLYSAKIISTEQISKMEPDYFILLSKYTPVVYKTLNNYIFCNLASADFKRLSKILPADECKNLMARVFSDMTYNHLANLSDILSKDDYNDLAARIFEISVKKIRGKSKIKIGFYFEHSSKWCGDELYQLFERDPRFEPTIFFCTRGNELTKKEFLQDFDRFKSRGFNVVSVKVASNDITPQDILFNMSPYDTSTPAAFRLLNLNLTTLLAHIPYSLSISYRKIFINWHFFRVVWRMFLTSTIQLELYDKICCVGMPRGIYSGYPKMDIFFRKNISLNFNWKSARPNAKKIIWAPHHSITGTTLPYATFQWNYKFMYEFAKAHPEISWIVKPHPHLLITAVSAKVFPSIEALKKYLQKWDDLPNAQVYLGSYYQAMFATSDGMIQDSGSFIAEYQYANKPMIYLMREGNIEKMNDLAKEILKVSYLVDGQDFDEIADMMQKVFIEGNDYKAAERKAVFDKYLNYPKTNGMLASEFIFKSITDELKEA